MPLCSPTKGPISTALGGFCGAPGGGRFDILWRNTVNGNNRIWQMDGATVVLNQGIPAVPTTWEIQ